MTAQPDDAGKAYTRAMDYDRGSRSPFNLDARIG